MALEVIPTGGGNATADSISIPQTDLAAFGVTAAEMTNDATGLARSVWGIVKAVQAFNFDMALGISKPASASLSITPDNFTNRTYSLTIQKYVDLSDGSNGVVPLPISGTNSGVGGFALTDIFSNAVKVAAAGAVANESVLIPTADLTAIDSTITHGPLDITSGQDNRNVLSAMYEAMAETIELRSGTTASAFVTLNRGSLGLITTIPAAYIDGTNPTSNLSPVNVADGQVALLSKTHTISIQTEDDDSNDTIDVRVVTS